MGEMWAAVVHNLQLQTKAGKLLFFFSAILLLLAIYAEVKCWFVAQDEGAGTRSPGSGTPGQGTDHIMQSHHHIDLVRSLQSPQPLPICLPRLNFATLLPFAICYFPFPFPCCTNCRSVGYFKKFPSYGLRAEKHLAICITIGWQPGKRANNFSLICRVPLIWIIIIMLISSPKWFWLDLRLAIACLPDARCTMTCLN